MNAADMWTIATSLTDSLIIRWFGFVAALVIAGTAIARKVRTWDAAAEERRRQHDADAFNAALNGRLDETNETWLFECDEFMDGDWALWEREVAS